MDEIHYIHFKLPGHYLGNIESYHSLEDTYDRECSIQQNNDSTFTFYITNRVWGWFGKLYSNNIISNKDIDKITITNGKELLCWLCREGNLALDGWEDWLYKKLKDFDQELSEEFMQAIIECNLYDG